MNNMQEKTIQELENLAKELSSQGKKWHFHILTPTCQLNNTDKYALIIENSTQGNAYVCYSDKPYMDIGKKLVKLLHGDNVIQEDASKKTEEPSPQVRRLLDRAKTLKKQGSFWHHHMLFPDCIFNNNKGKWTIIFEDQENNETIESITDEEPKSDLKHIEAEFYNQK